MPEIHPTPAHLPVIFSSRSETAATMASGTTKMAETGIPRTPMIKNTVISGDNPGISSRPRKNKVGHYIIKFFIGDWKTFLQSYQEYDNNKPYRFHERNIFNLG